MNSPPPSSRPAVRWWPLLLLTATTALALTLIWTIYAPEDRQSRILATLAVATLGAAATLVWWLFFSRVAMHWRGFALLPVLCALWLAHSRWSFEGMDGDFLPQFRRRGVAVEEVRGNAGAQLVHMDWPGFQGPRRDGTVADLEIEADWQTHPPELVWRRALGRGCSSFAIVADAAYTQILDEKSGVECLVCLDLATGEERWRLADDSSYRSDIAGDGPRATPTVQGEGVFAVTGVGHLLAANRRDGTLRFSVDVHARGGERPVWGDSASPWVMEDVVVVTGGGDSGLLQGYAIADGTLRFATGSDQAGYSSPTVLVLDSVPQIVTFNLASVTGFALGGALLWSHPFAAKEVHVSQPLPVGEDRLLVSAGYGRGSQCLQVRREPTGSFDVSVLWQSLRMKSKFSNMVAVDGSVYGFDDGILACMDSADGSSRWKAGRYGHGQMLRIGSHLLLLSEDGRLVLVAVDPREHRELALLTVFDGKTWNPLAFAAPFLLVRSDWEAALYRMPMASPN